MMISYLLMTCINNIFSYYMSITYNNLPKRYKIMKESEYTSKLQEFVEIIVQPHNVNLTKYYEDDYRIVYADVEECKLILGKIYEYCASYYNDIKNYVEKIKGHIDLLLDNIYSLFVDHNNFLDLISSKNINNKYLNLLVLKYNELIVNKLKINELAYKSNKLDIEFIKNIFLSSTCIIFNDKEITDIIITFYTNIHFVIKSVTSSKACIDLYIHIDKLTSWLHNFYPNFNTCHTSNIISATEYMQLLDILNNIFKIKKCGLIDETIGLLCDNSQKLSTFSKDDIKNIQVYLIFERMLYNKPSYYDRFGYVIDDSAKKHFNEAIEFLDSTINSIDDIDQIYNRLIVNENQITFDLKYFLKNHFTKKQTIREYFRYLYETHKCSDDNYAIVTLSTYYYDAFIDMHYFHKIYNSEQKKYTITFSHEALHKINETDDIHIIVPRYINNCQVTGYKFKEHELIKLDDIIILKFTYYCIQTIYLKINRSYFKIAINNQPDTMITKLNEIEQIHEIYIPQFEIGHILFKKDIKLSNICTKFHNFSGQSYIDHIEYMQDILLEYEKYKYYYQVILDELKTHMTEYYKQLCMLSYLRVIIMRHKNLLIKWNQNNSSQVILNL